MFEGSMLRRQRETLPNGSTLEKRFDGETLKEEFHRLPSGKTIAKLFDTDGSVRAEVHTYTNKLACNMRFRGGHKIEEYYTTKGQNMIPRIEYEKLRTNYFDMPPADHSVPDQKPI